MNSNPPVRIVLAKVGLDGHDRGIKVVARSLRDAGFHVIYTGLWQTADAIARAVADEDADWLGISILSGAQMTHIPRVLAALRERGCDDVGVIVGGTIPADEIPILRKAGVAYVFGPGTTMAETVKFLHSQERRVLKPSDFVATGLDPGDRAALSRRLTLISSGVVSESPAVERTRAVPPAVAFTGSAGAGKSSLLGAVADYLAERGEKIGILACDPESPLTGGALLGDRCRIGGAASDRIFVRSLSTVAGQQGIAARIGPMISVMQAFGFNRLFLETVGAGQGDVAVRQVADVLVLVLQPQTGDELQWEKAGILELADVIVVNKSDLVGADRTAADVREQLNRPGVAIIQTSVVRGEGIDDLCRVLDQLTTVAQASS